MHFSLGLHTCRFTEGEREVVNPFTNESYRLPNEGCFSDSECAAMQQCVRSVRSDGPNPLGEYIVHFENVDIHTDLGVVDLEQDMRSIRLDFVFKQEGPLGDDVVWFLFTLAQSGNACVASTVDPWHVAVTAPQDSDAFNRRWPKAHVVSTPFELRSWLEKSLRDELIL